MSFFNQEQFPIVDLRAKNAYQQSHIKSACHIPLSYLIQRMHSLPAKSQPLRLVGSESEIQQATKLLELKGYEVSSSLIWNDESCLLLSSLSMLEIGDKSQRLWQPAPILNYFVKTFGSQFKNKRALDIACGAGRDSVFLAMNGWQVSAVDYLPAAIEKLNQLALSHDVKVDGYQVDLEQEPKPFQKIEGVFNLIVVVRYLHRPLLAQIKNKIDLGGYIVYQTFYEGCQRLGRPKNPRYILQANELATIFEGFDILIDEIEYLPDGRPTNIFIAKKVRGE